MQIRTDSIHKDRRRENGRDFGFFDYTKPGKGVSKEDVNKKGIALYFDILLRRFWKLIPLNLMYIIASVPAIIIGWFISTFLVSWAAAQTGIELREASSALSLLGIFMTIVLLHICGSGPATAALTYVLRKYANDTHAWVWTDFKDSFKNNFKQGIALYLINTLVLFLLMFSFLFYSYAQKTSVFYVLRAMIIARAALFYMMQMYVYQMVTGVELKLKYIYKNAFLLTILSLPKNIIAAIISGGILYAVFSITMRVPLIGIILIGLLLYPLITFTQIFMTNNTVKKYMLPPTDEPQKEDIDSDFED